ncbi:MAG: hypothetical protein AAF236_02320 [Verrucomicrobiota bacterium]
MKEDQSRSKVPIYPGQSSLLILPFLILVAGIVSVIPIRSCTALDFGTINSALAEAMLDEDLEQIHEIVAAATKLLGDRAGVPEEAPQYRAVPSDALAFSEEEAHGGFLPWFERLEAIRWWEVGTDPTQLESPLRVPASVILGNVAACRAELGDSAQSLTLATDAAAFLIWSQAQAGAGLYPFPAARDTSDSRAMQVASRFLEHAERAGKLNSVVRRGWIFQDLGDGGLQFDNGECGVAMLELYQLTREKSYLDSARAAADWAIAAPLCTNWNYNAFSVDLLAGFYLVTGEEAYRTAALEKARFGVIPGQLREGPNRGRWFDPHNARAPYHYIMMRALARLAGCLPADHPDREAVVEALRLGLQTRNAEILAHGVMNKDDAIPALILTARVFETNSDFLEKTLSLKALDLLERLAATEYRHGKAPLSPASWGLLMEWVASRGN